MPVVWAAEYIDTHIRNLLPHNIHNES